MGKLKAVRYGKNLKKVGVAHQSITKDAMTDSTIDLLFKLREDQYAEAQNKNLGLPGEPCKRHSFVKSNAKQRKSDAYQLICATDRAMKNTFASAFGKEWVNPISRNQEKSS